MITTVPTQIRINRDVKEKSIKIFNKLGLDMSSAVNIFLNQCVINEGLPFHIAVRKNDSLANAIEEAYKVHNSNNAKGYHDVNKLFKDMGYDEKDII